MPSSVRFKLEQNVIDLDGVTSGDPVTLGLIILQKFGPRVSSAQTTMVVVGGSMHRRRNEA
jgi:hypothetical protein